MEILHINIRSRIRIIGNAVIIHKFWPAIYGVASDGFDGIPENGIEAEAFCKSVYNVERNHVNYKSGGQGVLWDVIGESPYLTYMGHPAATTWSYSLEHKTDPDDCREAVIITTRGIDGNYYVYPDSEAYYINRAYE